MKYIAIVKTVADLHKPKGVHKKLPKEYPLECKECDSYEEAKALVPGDSHGRVMSAEAYQSYHAGIKIIHRHVVNQKSWWARLWRR